jgi:Tfp pilus assembly protein PilF
MSIILDALRRGRGAQAPGPNPNAAQTDAVLQTLGYGRFSPATPLNRLKRALVVVAFAVLMGIVLWVGVIWLTQAYLSPTRPETAEARSVTVATPTSKPTYAPTGVTVGTRSDPVPPTPSETARTSALGASTSEGTASADSSNAPVAPIAPVAPNAPDAMVVPPSRRGTSSAPLAPTGGASRTAMSRGAAAKAATVTTGGDHFRRGVMYQRLGDFENAQLSYRQVLQRDDLNVEAHNNLGVLYRDKGLYDDATTHFQRAIAINPGYARARNNLGVVYLNQRTFDTAASQFHAALAIDVKNVASMVNLSIVEKELGRRDQARGWLTRALAADPRNAEAHYNLGLLEDESGNRTQAVTHYRAFLQYGAAVHPTLVGEVRNRIAQVESGK